MKHNKQTGFTLVELMVVMGVLSVVMGTAVTLLFQMFDLHIRREEDSARTRSTNYFVSAFRQDIQTYGKPEFKTGLIAAGEKPLRWTLDGKTLEYELLSGKHPEQWFVRRTEKTGEKIHCVEDYVLPDGTALSTFEGKDKNAGLIALLLWRQMPGKKVPQANELNPFEQSGAEYAGVWRTVLARFRTATKAEGKP